MESLGFAGGNAKWCSFYGTQFLKRLNIKLPYDPAIPSLGIYIYTLKN